MKKTKSNFPHILMIPKDVVIRGSVSLATEKVEYNVRRSVDKQNEKYTEVPEPWSKK